jgi:hypothetical protein
MIVVSGGGLTITGVPGQRNLSVSLAAGHESKSNFV